MSSSDAFVQTILEQPEDDGPRLVFADWLEERGDPHAELIRVQCELPHVTEDDPRRPDLLSREQELIAEQGERWLRPARELGLSARFRRGFLDVQIKQPGGVRTLLDCGRRLFANAWVLHVRLGDATTDLEDIAELAVSPLLSRVQTLDFSRAGFRIEGAQKLAQARFRCRLTSLKLNHVQLSSEGLRALVDGMDLSRLEELELIGNEIRVGGVRALAFTPKLKRLRVLDLSYNAMRNLGGQYLAESPHLGQLQSLYVRGNRIGLTGQKALRHRFGPRVHLGSADTTI